MNNFSFQIIKHIGTLFEDEVTTELNLVSWGNRTTKYDLRRWKLIKGEKVPYKGLTLGMDELKALRDILNDMDINEPYLADTEPDAAAD